jgi:hypothetical protein
MHDGISLESLGVPTAAIVTTVFLHEARVQREALGMTGIVPVVIEHPLSSLSDEAIRDRATQALAQVVGVWRGTQPDPA